MWAVIIKTGWEKESTVIPKGQLTADYVKIYHSTLTEAMRRWCSGNRLVSDRFLSNMSLFFPPFNHKESKKSWHEKWCLPPCNLPPIAPSPASIWFWLLDKVCKCNFLNLSYSTGSKWVAEFIISEQLGLSKRRHADRMCVLIWHRFELCKITWSSCACVPVLMT